MSPWFGVFFAAAWLFSFVATGYGLCHMAAFLDMSRPRMAFIPFAQTFRLGELADEVSTFAGTVTRLRKGLLLWKILFTVCAVALVGFTATLMSLVESLNEPPAGTVTVPERGMELMEALSPVLLLLLLLFLVVGVVHTIFACRALHRVFRLYAPQNATFFTVLAVLIPPAKGVLFLLLAHRMPILPPFVDRFLLEHQDLR